MDAMDISDTMKGETTPYIDFLIVLNRAGHGKGLMLLRLFPDNPLSAIATKDTRRLICPNNLSPPRSRLI